MNFNKAKTKVIFHTHLRKYLKKGHTFKGMEIVQSNKVLGYIVNKKLNNLGQIDKASNYYLQAIDEFNMHQNLNYVIECNMDIALMHFYNNNQQ